MAVEHATGDFLTQPGAGPAAVRGGALRVAGYFGGVVLGVGSSALLFRELGVVDTGRYVTILSFVTIVDGLADCRCARAPRAGSSCATCWAPGGR